MEFRNIEVRFSAGKNVKEIPKALKEYCAALEGVPPNAEMFLGDPDLDLRTLHASAGFRDAVVRLGLVLEKGQDPKIGKVLHSNLVVDWKSPTQHEISPNGQTWTDSDGTALKYTVTYTTREGTSTVYMGILFGAAK